MKSKDVNINKGQKYVVGTTTIPTHHVHCTYATVVIHWERVFSSSTRKGIQTLTFIVHPQIKQWIKDVDQASPTTLNG